MKKRIIGIILCCALLLSTITTIVAFNTPQSKSELNPVSVSVEQATGTMDLTTIGDIDWVLKTGDSEIKKQKNQSVSNVLKVEPLTNSADHALTTMDNSPITFSWNNGTPIASANDFKKGGVYGYKNGNASSVNTDISAQRAGYKITIPVSETSRVLTFASGAWQSDAQVAVYVNEQSEPIYSNNDLRAGSTAVNKKYTLNIRSNTSVIVECTINKKKHADGNVNLTAVTLGNLKIDDKSKIDEQTASGGMDLTKTGTLDWLHITASSQGLDSKPVYTRKNITTPLINFNLMRDISALTAQNDSRVLFSWSDGPADNKVVTNSALGGVVTYLPGDEKSVGKLPTDKEVGYNFSVEKSDKNRIFTFVTGIWNAKGKISVYLNGEQSAIYESKLSAGDSAVAKKYMIRLSAGDSVSVSFRLEEKTHSYGNLSVGAATLGIDSEGIDFKAKLNDMLDEALSFDPEGLNEELANELNAEIAYSQNLLKQNNVSNLAYYEASIFVENSLKKAITSAGKRNYTDITSPGLVASFGWEGDKHAPISYIDGSYLLRDNANTTIHFGVWDIPGDIKWYNKEGYLPCLVSEFSKNDLSHSVENFADQVEINGNKFEIAYSRMTTTNTSKENKNLPRVSSGLIPLNDAAKNIGATIKPGQTIVRDYAIAADRFGNPYSFPSENEIIALGTWDAHYTHMKDYWNNRLSEISEITKLPDEKLINAYKAGYIYTLIIRDDIPQSNGKINYQLHVGENGYDEMYDHDTIGIVASLLTMGDFTFAKEYLATLPAQLQYDDAKWKYSWPYALYLQKTGDLDFIKSRFDDIKKNTHFVESDRIDSGKGIIKKTNAIDSNGYWLIDNWAALTGLTTYRYLCESLLTNTNDQNYQKEIDWASSQYTSLLSAVEKSQADMREKYDYDYLSISMEVPTEQSARSDPRDGNWASMFLFGRWAWDGYLFGADQTNSKMISLIDDTYTHGFDRRKDISNTIYNFGGYPHGIYSSAYNAGYGSGALRGEQYRDCGIKAYQFMINNSMSGPFGWWEGVNYPDSRSPWDIPHAQGGGGSCQHMWGQSTNSKVLFDSLISEKSDGTAIIGRGIPLEWILDGKEIEIKNYPVAKGSNIGFNLKTTGKTITINLTGDSNVTAVSLELLAFKDNIKDANGLTFDNEKGTVSIPAGTKTAQITLTKELIAHNVTVTGGTADKAKAVKGELVTILADSAPKGKIFDHWESTDGITFNKSTAIKTTFVMPEKDVNITAVYKNKPVKEYNIEIVSGKSDKEKAAEGETVVITADNAPSGKMFDKWVASDGVVLEDDSAISTSFTMPNKEVTITATYKDEPAGTITLSDNKTGINFTGVIAPGSILSIIPKESSSEPELLKQMNGYEILSTFDASLSGDGFTGNLTLKIPLSASNNGMTVIVKQRLADGSIATHKALCTNGNIVLTVNELGTFMLGISKTPIPNTGAEMSLLNLIVVAALTGTTIISIVFWRKRKKSTI